MDEGNWGVLGLSRDPVPGDPVAVRALATYSQGEARYWQGHEQTLRTTAERGRAMRMEGEFAAPYRERLAQLPANATALRSAHQNAETALAQYAQQLEQAKTEARTALRQGSQAKESYNQAMRAREQAIAEMNALPKVVPPEQYPYVLQQWEYLQGQANRAQMFAEQAEQEWNQARQLAIQAGEQANAAEASCAQRIQAATPGTTNTTSSNQAPQPLTAGGPAATQALTTSERRAVRSLQRQIDEHTAKLAAYRADPDAFDNQGLLARAPTPEVRQRIIDGRIRHLQTEISTFQTQINKILGDT